MGREGSFEDGGGGGFASDGGGGWGDFFVMLVRRGLVLRLQLPCRVYRFCRGCC